ncbi:MAG: DegQ family serine endoprotease [Gammaproteobacteria bacterium]|jgi:serine protease Do|nr:DegQ family serine endoprotease [Gammaproteobacteria bacterium]
MIHNLYARSAGLFLSLCLLATVPLQSGAAVRGLPDFTDLVKEASPAVVNISTTTKVAREQPGRQPPPGHGSPAPGTPFDDFLRRFFGDEYGNAPEEFDEESLGSGFIVSKDGYVLTNAHVIGNADEIVVRLSDRREFIAELVGSDRRSDVALLKIDAKDLPVAKIGRSADLEVGGWVMAIGSPFGFEHSVTAGIVSAIGRSLPNENYTPFIQTDVAINPGNSGGPLLNMDGEVVGINSQIYSRTGGFMGLSFAIPIDLAMNVVDQLRSTGHVSRGWLGILIQDVTRELAESFGMKRPVGALVARVLPDSPAEKAGIQVGDIIVEYEGRAVESSSTLPPMVGQTRVGSQAGMKVMRDGKEIRLDVTISELPEDEAVAGGGAPEVPSGTVERLGLVGGNLSADQREELEGKSGVVVEQVDSGPAARAGVRRGDIILRFDNVEVRDLAHLRELVKAAPADKSVPILVQRRGSPIFLALKITEE